MYTPGCFVLEGDFLHRLLDMLEKQFGTNTEFVLHDLRGEYDETIVDIRNGHITGREIGGCGSNLGLEVLRGSSVNGDKFNYITACPDGKLLRSSSLYFRDENGKVIGSLCINTDITETLKLEKFLYDYNLYNVQENPVQEVFATNVNQLLEHLIQRAQQECGKQVDAMNRQDKIEFLRYLDSKGAFLIQKSSERVQDYLKISKYTLYEYLKIIHMDREDRQPAGTGCGDSYKLRGKE